jgi:hypothetical protein
MRTFIPVTLLLGYVVILIYAVLRVVQDVFIRTSPLLRPLSDCDMDRDDRVPRTLAAVPTANSAVETWRDAGEQP